MAREALDHRTYTPQGQTWDDAQRSQFFGKLQSGQAVEGRDGWRYEHAGGGWSMTNDPVSGTPGSPGAAPPAQPGPGEPPTTAPGVPQRPSPAPNQSPLPPSPAPQIPLGSTGQQGWMGGAMRPTGPGAQIERPIGAPGRVTGPGLIDASQAGPQGQGDPLQAQVRTALMGMLGQNVNAASLTDPDIAPQQRAFQAATERSALKNRAGLMEQASAEGIADSEAIRAAGRQIETAAGQAIGANDAALIGEKLKGRREQLAQAVQVASAMGLAQEANDLQRQLANLDAQIQTRGQDISREGMQLSRDLANLESRDKQYLADLDADLRRQGYGLQERLAMMDAELRRLGINTQGNLGGLELALRRELGIGELNLGLLQTMLQNQQVGNRLGFDIGQWQSILNRDALLAAMGGG